MGRLSGLLVFLAVSFGAGAQLPAPPFSIEASFGREDLSSPLLRIDENGPLIFIDGISRLAGNYGSIDASGLKDWAIGGGATFGLFGHANWKSAPGARDLDFGIVDMNAMFRYPFPGASLGAGPTVERIWVAGDRFRDSVGLQADLAGSDSSDGHWAVIADIVRQRHPGDFSDFNARAASVSIIRHLEKPLPYLSGMDFEAGFTRTDNANGFEDLSSRGIFAHVGIETRAAALDWSAGLMAMRENFRESGLDGIPARRDRFVGVDLGVSKDLEGGASVRLEFSWGRNAANVEIYDNRYRQLSVTYSYGR